MSFVNKTAISTGAASGMGWLLAQNGAKALTGKTGGRNAIGRWRS